MMRACPIFSFSQASSCRKMAASGDVAEMCGPHSIASSRCSHVHGSPHCTGHPSVAYCNSIGYAGWLWMAGLGHIQLWDNFWYLLCMSENLFGAARGHCFCFVSVCCMLSVVITGYWGIFWDSCFGTVLDGVFSWSMMYECMSLLLWWCCCSTLFVSANETVFLFGFSIFCCCNHCSGASGVLPSLAHQFCLALGNFFAPSIMRLLIVTTCIAVSAVSSCFSLHAGSLQTPQNCIVHSSLLEVPVPIMYVVLLFHLHA